jgi:RNA polymerase sigma factor (sigma-70 family)
MDINILEYKPVIDNVLAKLKVKKSQREDMTQECYVALLEKQHHLEHGILLGRGEAYASSICSSRVRDVWRKENQTRPEHKEKHHLKFDSLSDPRVYRKAIKISIPKEEELELTTAELESGILSLPFDEYRVVYEIYVQGKTQPQVAKDLGISERTVWDRNQRGIKLLKKYFEVEDGD